jgi:MerR family transcriptional regulator/heat shock protein HspR
MDEPQMIHIVFQQCRHVASSYNEQEAVAASHLSLGALRRLHATGLVEGEKMGEELRYSEEEIIQLRRIRRLQENLGVNLAGVEVILHLLRRLDALRQELEQERGRARRQEETP